MERIRRICADSMRNLFVLFLLFLATLTVGQNIEKGIYKGYEFPFVICFFTYTDSIAEVEYFSKKSGTIFGHKPPKQVVQTGLSSKLYFHSLDDRFVFIGGGVI